MNEITLHPGMTTPALPSEVLRPLLEPWRRARKLWPVLYGGEYSWGLMGRLEADGFQGDRDLCEFVTEALGGEAGLEQTIDQITEAIEHRASHQEVVTIVSAMLDAKATFDPIKRAPFLDMLFLVLEVEGEFHRFSKYVFASVAYEWVRDRLFVPDASEILPQLQKRKRAFSKLEDDLRNLNCAYGGYALRLVADGKATFAEVGLNEREPEELEIWRYDPDLDGEQTSDDG